MDGSYGATYIYNTYFEHQPYVYKAYNCEPIIYK